MNPETHLRAVAFVVARLTSSRLPRKQLRHIGPKTILEWIMDALHACAELDQVVLATVDEPENEPLRDLAARQGWDCFWYPGEVDDVVGRLTRAAHEYNADICLLISADCPLIHGPSVDQLVARMRASPEADCLVLPANERGEVCLLEGVQIARRAAWSRADVMSDRPELREHQFPVLYRDPARFRHVTAQLDDSIYGPHQRMSVDTWADLDFMQALFGRLSRSGAPFTLPAAVAVLSSQPELKQLNAHVHQRALVENVRRVLMIVDAGGRYGLGHFMRCRELAGQIVERLSWPVTFLVDDERAVQMARSSGFHVQWGALGRDMRGVSSEPLNAINTRSISAHDLVVIDISAQRSLAPGWRSRWFAQHTPVVMLDREDETASEVEMIIYPGVTGRAVALRPPRPAIVEGIEYIILRREVCAERARNTEKDIDLLVYLYDEEQRSRVEEIASIRGWRVEILAGFDADFAAKLARSRVFLSGYGQSFYEAVALSSCPVVWPLSAHHAADADAFYRALDLPTLRVDSAAGLERAVQPLLEGNMPALPALADGTPAIVARLAELLE